MPPAPSTMIMKSTRARCVIAHWERLKPFTAPLLLFCRRLACLNRAYVGAGDELLHAQGDDLVSLGHAAGDERGVFGEGRDGDRSQRQRAGVIDHVDGR